MSIDNWANFMFNERLDPKEMDEDDMMELIYLCEELAKVRGPLIRPYAKKIESRRFVVNMALDLGIDLLDLRNKRNARCLIGRGLLDIWMVEYEKRYGSVVGTLGAWEAKRRDVKTRLAKERKSVN